MVDDASPHPKPPQQAPSWRPGTTSSATGKKAATTPAGTEVSSSSSSTATTAPHVLLQAPCGTSVVGTQAVTCMPYPPGQDIQILPSYQPGYNVLDPAMVVSPCTRGVLPSPQQLILPGPPNQQVVLGSSPQGFTSPQLISAGVQCFQHDGVRQLQGLPLPVQLQLSQMQPPQRLNFRQQLLPVNQTMVQPLQVLGQGVPVSGVVSPTVQPLQVLGQGVPVSGMVSPGGLKVSVGSQIEGSTLLYDQQVTPNVASVQVFNDPSRVTGGSPQVLLPHFRSNEHSQICSVPFCASPCGTAYPAEVIRPAAPAYLPFTPVEQQPIVNYGPGAPLLQLARGPQFDFQVGSPCLVSGANACAPTGSIGPTVVVLPSQSWDTQRSILPTPSTGGTQTTVVAGVPVNTCYSIGPPTTTVSLDPSFPLQQSAIVPGSLPLLRTSSLGTTVPSSGVVQLVRDARGAGFPSSSPTCINVVPNSLAGLVPGDRFSRRQRGQSPGSSRQRSCSSQPFVSCCHPAASSSGQVAL